MSTSPQIDYDAIARQHGGSESTNSSAQVDYDSLAAQHGGKASTPKLTENGREIPEGGFGVGHYLKEQMPRGADLVHAVGLPTSMDELRQRGEQEANKTLGQRAKEAFMMSLGPGPQILSSMGKEAWRAVRHPLDPMAPVHAGAAANPFAAPVIDQMSEQGLGTKEANATGLTNAAMLAGGLAAPKVMGKVAEVAPDLSAKAKAISKVAARTVTGQVPVLGNVEALRTPTFGEYWKAITAKADPQLALFNKTPKLGDSPIMATADQPLLKADNLGQGKTASPKAATADNLIVPGSEGSRNMGPPIKIQTLEDQAANGDAVAKAILKDKATAAARENMPKDYQPSTVPRVASGEAVLNQALTSLDNKTLLKIARSRGVDVSQEAQLKPGAADNRIIKKIIDDFSTDELDEVRNQGIEIAAHKPVAADLNPMQGKELWHFKVLSQFFPDVSVPKAMQARAQFYMAKRPTVTPMGQQIRQIIGPENTPRVPTSDSDLEDLLRQSLQVMGNKK